MFPFYPCCRLGCLGAWSKLHEKSWEGRGASQVMLMVKNPSTNAGDIREAGLIPGSVRSPGGGRGNLLQYSCQENPMDKGT